MADTSVTTKSRARNFAVVIHSSFDEFVRKNIEDVLDGLVANSHAKELVGQTEISDNGSLHYQLSMRMPNPMSRTALCKKLEKLINDKEAKVHVEETKSEAINSYVLKEKTGNDDYPNVRMWQLDSRNTDGKPESRNSIFTQALEILEADNEESATSKVSRALKIIREKAPSVYALQADKLKQSFTGLVNVKSKQQRFDISTFNLDPVPLPKHGDPDPKSWVFHGKPGTGKTQFALAHFKNPVMISGPEDYKRINDETDGIVIDDCNYQLFSPQNVIHRVDVACDRTVNVKYSSAIVPAYLPRIFTINQLSRFFPKTCLPDERRAIQRRCNFKEFSSKCYSACVEKDGRKRRATQGDGWGSDEEPWKASPSVGDVRDCSGPSGKRLRQAGEVVSEWSGEEGREEEPGDQSVVPVERSAAASPVPSGSEFIGSPTPVPDDVSAESSVEEDQFDDADD